MPGKKSATKRATPIERTRRPAAKAPKPPIPTSKVDRASGATSGPVRRSSGTAAISTIDDYLSTVAGEKRVALERLRKAIRSVVPNAEECISYRIPAFRLDGTVIAGFSATVKGCSYFPFSGSTLRTLARELRGYDQTKASLHFRPEEPLSTTLVRSLLETRIAEIG